MGFWDFITGKGKNYNPNKEGSVNTPKQRHMSELLPGEICRITYFQYHDDVYSGYVISNNVGKREIYLKIEKIKGQWRYEIKSYDHYWFRNFSTINPEHMIKFENGKNLAPHSPYYPVEKT
ncbi:MAG: hypothetical protein V4547_18335 [Bacteroidota bacterium]